MHAYLSDGRFSYISYQHLSPETQGDGRRTEKHKFELRKASIVRSGARRASCSHVVLGREWLWAAEGINGRPNDSCLKERRLVDNGEEARSSWDFAEFVI